MGIMTTPTQRTALAQLPVELGSYAWKAKLRE
jgi:hypothetical protein